MREAVLEPVRDLARNLRGRRFAVPSITYKDEAIFLAMPQGLGSSSNAYRKAIEAARDEVSA